jgi:simple sugar transport system ATP-binding protein
MVGRDVTFHVEKKEIAPGDVLFSVREFSGENPFGGTPFHDIEFDIRKGEIFSIIGVAGNGQGGLVSAIVGLSAAQQGTVTFAGKHYTAQEWNKLKTRQIAYVPEDRYHTGAVGSMSIAENFGLTRLDTYSTGFGGWRIEREKMSHDSLQAIEDFQIKAETCYDTAGSLSGGNLQKLILARELARNPEFFIAEQPTQGLDISATEDIWKALLKCRENAAVLIVTGDLKEVLTLSDRIGVIYNGRLLDIIDAANSDEVGRVGLLMAGVES